VLNDGCTLVAIGGPDQRRAFRDLYE
jgi:hypothetical protein